MMFAPPPLSPRERLVVNVGSVVVAVAGAFVIGLVAVAVWCRL